MPEHPYALEDDDDGPDEIVTMTAPLPAVAAPSRGWEYRVEVVAVADVVEASRFAERLNAAAAEGWDLVEITSADTERKVLVLRRPRPEQREHRQVGFTPPTRRA